MRDYFTIASRPEFVIRQFVPQFLMVVNLPIHLFTEISLTSTIYKSTK